MTSMIHDMIVLSLFFSLLSVLILGIFLAC